MEKLSAARERTSHTALEERGDSSAVDDHGKAEYCRPACTAKEDQACQIIDCLPICNELLFELGVQLREQHGGTISLESFQPYQANLMPPPGLNGYQADDFLRWLLRTHLCIRSLDLMCEDLRSCSYIILEELSQDTRLMKLSVWFDDDDPALTDIAALLPRLRHLEELICFSTALSTDACAVALAQLLRTTTSLTSLAFKACISRGQPRKTFFDALAENTTLKSLELTADWTTADSAGELAEYVKSNRLITTLSVGGTDVDRDGHFLEDVLVSNGTLSTLEIQSCCGGERSVRFLTRIFAECPALKELSLYRVQYQYDEIPEATLMRCADALARNDTIEELKLPYHLWHHVNWIAFFALLPRNKRLKKLEVSPGCPADYGTLQLVLEALAQIKSSARVSITIYAHEPPVDLMHFAAFSTICISGEESVKLEALQRLPAFNHFTCLWLCVSDGDQSVFPSLAEYIRETTVLRELRLEVTRSLHPANAAPSSCWILVFDSILVNSSITSLQIFTYACAEYSDRLANAICRSVSITRMLYVLSEGYADATHFALPLSEAIGDNYNLLDARISNAKMEAEVARCYLKIREATLRNSGLVERAAAFNQISRLDWYTATALEKVSRHPALLRELAEREGVSADEVAKAIRSRLSSIGGLHDFMRVTGVVKESVKCVPPVDGCSRQLEDLNSDCWRLVRRYLSFDDVNGYTVAKPDHNHKRSHKKIRVR